MAQTIATLLFCFILLYVLFLLILKDRDQLVRYKFKWTDVEGMPVDNKLNKEEFLAFRHPESSALALNKMVETILNSLGKSEFSLCFFLYVSGYSEMSEQ